MVQPRSVENAVEMTATLVCSQSDYQAYQSTFLWASDPSFKGLLTSKKAAFLSVLFKAPL